MTADARRCDAQVHRGRKEVDEYSTAIERRTRERDVAVDPGGGHLRGRASDYCAGGDAGRFEGGTQRPGRSEQPA